MTYPWTRGDILRAADLDAALADRLSITNGGTINGPVTISADGAAINITATGTDWPRITMNDGSASNLACGYFEGRRGGLLRWTIELGGTSAETGANAGSNVQINRFNDDGSLLGLAVRISRDTGAFRIGEAPQNGVSITPGAAAANAVTVNCSGTGGIILGATGAKLGFNGTAAIAKPAVTGSRGGNAALASLLTQLAALGLITDSTTV